MLTINVPVVYMARDVMFFMPAISISRAIGRGWALKSRLFRALKWYRVKRVPFGPKKVERVAGHVK